MSDAHEIQKVQVLQQINQVLNRIASELQQIKEAQQRMAAKN